MICDIKKSGKIEMGAAESDNIQKVIMIKGQTALLKEGEIKLLDLAYQLEESIQNVN